jgi:hypothetical protein
MSALGAASRADLSISFGAGRTADMTLSLTGPGDVTGLDGRVVSRTWPSRDAGEVEPNLFPLVEFDQPGFPWRYTPAAPSGDRLRPWAVLLALTGEEMASLEPAGGRRPLPAVSIDGAPLPRLDQSWAWAHVQVTRTDAADEPDIEELAASEPHRVVSRLVCPRRLRADTRYTVVLVPAFESGRRAGLGESIEGSADPHAPAWELGASSAVLPVYYRWSFTTGQGGDFEQLARRLQPAVASPGIGAAAMDASRPGGQLPPAATQPMQFGGALRSPALASLAWDDAERSAFVSSLASWLNRPADLLDSGAGDRAIAPPLYARWHAAEDRYRDQDPPVWFNELNADPRLRAAAGLGAEVVRREQHNLMATAWQQLPGISDVNDGLRVAQLAREVTASLLARHLDSAHPDDALAITAPVHARLRASPRTVVAHIAASPLPEGATGATVRSMARSLGPVARRQSRDPARPSALLSRLNRREIDPAPQSDAPDELPTVGRVGTSLADEDTTMATATRARTAGRVAGIVALVLVVVGIVAFVAGFGAVAAAGALAMAIVAGAVSLTITRRADRQGRAVALRDDTLAAETMESIVPGPAFIVRESALTSGQSEPSSATAREVEAFRAAAADMLQSVDASRPEPAAPVAPLALDVLARRVVAAVDPRDTIERPVADRLAVADELAWNPADRLEPVLVGPEFDRPMYRSLVELSPSWLLPGADAVRRNTVSLLETNPQFVEAYLVGLNHEMGRELLWREFPTDPRKTYFRRFWDSVTPSARADIDPIHTWEPGSSLGQHRPGRPDAADARLVLLVRGDMVHRYPDVEIYAARAVWTETRRDLGDEHRPPVFAGRIGDDMAFYGFELTCAQARGSGGDIGEGDPGWYFVLQERAAEVRFGLDASASEPGPPRRWSDLAWDHVIDTAAGGADHYIDLDAERPDTRLIDEPGGAAWHADAGLGPTGARGSDLAYIMLQTPVRVAFHARDLLPETDA